jgi:Flp pilus assembly protein TadD
VAEIDLGAVDGLKQDVEVRIQRGDRLVDVMTMTAVFRERSRGRVRSSDVRRGDRVAIDPAVTASAFLSLATARRAAGDVSGARELAARAVPSVDVASITPESGEVLNDLGVVQIERRDLAGAERTLQLAQSVAVGPTQMRVVNNLGALAVLRGDRNGASAFYRRAASLAGDSPDVAADRQAIEKNLAAVHAAR